MFKLLIRRKLIEKWFYTLKMRIGKNFTIREWQSVECASELNNLYITATIKTTLYFECQDLNRLSELNDDEYRE